MLIVEWRENKTVIQKIPYFLIQNGEHMQYHEAISPPSMPVRSLGVCSM